MSQRVVEITAPSRLHFGMLSINRAGGRQFGGVGAMVEGPGLRMTMRRAARLETVGLLSQRTRQVARLLSGGKGEPQCRIEVLQAPREHVGLGTGTQLSMAIAAGFNALEGGPRLEPIELARRVGRGERSAVGLYGFVYGGLIFEAGKAAGEEISPLVARVELPSQWRFVLICPHEERGLSGEQERRAFAALPAVSDERLATLEGLAREKLVPAASRADFDGFSEALYEFGYLAGLSFASQQGGPFRGRRNSSLVALVRQLGVRGVGQSSWGPTLFALLPAGDSAGEFVRSVRRYADDEQLEFTISTPANSGASIESEKGTGAYIDDGGRLAGG
jgi:beta-RFAP synthase